MKFVPPKFEPPFRVLLLMSATQGWYGAPDVPARERILTRMHAFFEGWTNGGAQVLASFDDDFFLAGQPSSLGWSIFVIYEVPNLELVAERIQSVREEVDGMRLDNCFRMEAHVGRHLFNLDR